jgi:hypothetical protein
MIVPLTPPGGKPSRAPRVLPPWRRSGGNTIAGDSVLNPDFKDCIRFLNANGVKYLVVGGYAVALHGYPRYTKDLDIWVERTPDNASAIIKALREFGFSSSDLRAGDFLVPDRIVHLGQPPNRIDLLTAIDGVEFDDAWKTRTVQELDGVPVNFIGRGDLLKNKRASGRHQDLADLENLG